MASASRGITPALAAGLDLPRMSGVMVSDVIPDSSAETAWGRHAVPKLGIIGVDVDDTTAALLPDLRYSSGVFVTARTQMSSGNQAVPLEAGDVIHAVNRFEVRSLDGLRLLVDDVKANSEIVLQVERNARLMYLTCQIY